MQNPGQISVQINSGMLFIGLLFFSFAFSGCGTRYAFLNKDYVGLVSQFEASNKEQVLWSANCEFGSTIDRVSAKTVVGVCVLGIKNFYFLVEEPGLRGPRIYSQIAVEQIRRIGEIVIHAGDEPVTQIQISSQFRTFFFNARHTLTNLLLEQPNLSKIEKIASVERIQTDVDIPNVIYVSPVVVPRRK